MTDMSMIEELLDRGTLNREEARFVEHLHAMLVIHHASITPEEHQRLRDIYERRR